MMDYLLSVIKFMDVHVGAMTGLLTIVTVGVSILAIVFNARTLKEMRKTRQDSIRPIIVPEFFSKSYATSLTDDTSNYHGSMNHVRTLTLSITNCGNSAAFNMWCEMITSPFHMDEDIDASSYLLSWDLPIVKNNGVVVMPGNTIEYIVQRHTKTLVRDFSIRIHYKDFDNTDWKSQVYTFSTI